MYRVPTRLSLLPVAAVMGLVVALFFLVAADPAQAQAGPRNGFTLYPDGSAEAVGYLTFIPELEGGFWALTWRPVNPAGRYGRIVAVIANPGDFPDLASLEGQRVLVRGTYVEFSFIQAGPVIEAHTVQPAPRGAPRRR
jgi:hypothetical protein